MNEAYQTTYDLTYRREPFLPRIKIFHQLPSIELCCIENLPLLERNLYIKSAHQREKDYQKTPCLGLGSKKIDTLKYQRPKPIVGTKEPRKLAVELIAQQAAVPKSRKPIYLPAIRDSRARRVPLSDLDKMANEYRFNTTALTAENYASLPCSKAPLRKEGTAETNADKIKDRSNRYELKSEAWQRQGRVWDRIQSRAPTEHHLRDDPTKDVKRLPALTEPKVNEKIRELLKNDQLTSTYVRQCPGYAGFVPREPLETPMEKSKVNPAMESLMRSSYRPYPTEELIIKKFAHEGPLSKTVTLTCPYNPFNKVDKDEEKANILNPSVQ